MFNLFDSPSDRKEALCVRVEERRGFVFLALLGVITFLPSSLCLSDETSFAQVAEELIALKEAGGSPPNDMDLYRLAFREGRELTGAEMSKAFDLVISFQKPSVSINQLASIIKSKRGGITTFRTQFTESVVSGKNLEKTSEKEYLYVFVPAKNCYLIDSTVLDRSKRREVNSYDGSNFYRLVFTENGAPNLIISEKGQISDSLLPSSPLQQSLLFDTNAISQPHAWYDFSHFADSHSVYVFEKKEVVNGRECILIANRSQRVCLDPEMDFAVTKVEWVASEFRPGNKDIIFSGVNLVARRSLKDFRNYGNSLWLPTSIENEYYDDAGVNVDQRDFIQVKNIEINSKLDEDYFANIAPPDTYVIDANRGVVYNLSDSPSINSLLKNTVKSKRVMIFRYISVSLGIIMIVIWAILKYRTYRQQRQ